MSEIKNKTKQISDVRRQGDHKDTVFFLTVVSIDD